MGRNKTRAEFNLGACNGTVCLIQRNSMRHSVRVTHFNVVMACRSLSVFVCVCNKECVSLVNVTHSDGTIRLYLLDLIDTDTHTQIDKTLLLNTILWPSCLREILFQQKEKRKYENVFFSYTPTVPLHFFCNHHNVHSASGNKIPLGSQSFIFIVAASLFQK